MSWKRIRVVEVQPVRLIGVVSDTHLPTRGRRLPEALWRELEGADLILHAGDLVEEKVLHDLSALAPVYAVAGNMDPPPLARRLGEKLLVRAGPVTVGLVHGYGSTGTACGRARDAFSLVHPPPAVIVFGHSHQPYNEPLDNILMFNPGSAVDPRRMPRPSCGRLHLSGKEVTGEIVYL